MKIPYYLQRRLTNIAIDVVMYSILAASLFPIGWMVFNSFKDNTEILSGRLGLNRASTDIAFLQAEGDWLWVGSADGGIALFDIPTGQMKKRHVLRTSATSFTSDNHNIWIGSSDKGLFRISKDRPEKIESVPFHIAGLDVTKISATYLAASEPPVGTPEKSNLWFAVEQKGIADIFEISTQALGSVRRIPVPGLIGPVQALAKDPDRPVLWVGGDSFVIQLDIESGRVLSQTMATGTQTRILRILPTPQDVFVGTEGGIIRLDRRSGGQLPLGNLSQKLGPVRVPALSFDGKILTLGTNIGLTRTTLGADSVQTMENLFTTLSKNHPEGWVHGEVLAMAPSPKGIFVGTTQGRSSFIPAHMQAPVQSFRVPVGHFLFRWRNYIDLWQNIDFGKYLRNSLIICGITMLIAMVLTTLAAYALARFSFPGNQFISMAILATQMIPAIMYLIPLFSMFVKFTDVTGIPIKGTFVGIILIYSAFFIPFSIWILRGFFAAIPRELEEAARIDGCSPFQVFWHVVLPLAIPGIVATGIYVFLTAWDELMFAWVLTSADTMTIPVGIRLFVGNYQNRFDLMMAAATVATIPVMILFFLLQRHIVKGLTAGAIKG